MPRDVLLRFVLCALLIVAPPVTFSAEPSFWRELRDALSTIGDDLTDGVSGKNQRQLLESAIEQLINEAPPTDAEARTQEPVHIDLKEIQARLTALGYAPGPVDGVFGQKTQSAIAEYQADHGLIVDGRATNKLISALRASTVGTELAGIHTEVSPSLAITQSRSYLEQMVAEADAQVHRLANNIDPQTREMARRSGIDIDGMVARQLAGYERQQREAAEIKRLTSGQAANSNRQPQASVSSQRSPSSAQHTSDMPSTLAGVWEGNIQFMPHRIKPGTPTSYNYAPMQLVIDPTTNRYITNYPEMGCMGQLFLEKRIVTGDKSRYIFREKLVQQSNSCTDDGVVTFDDPLGSHSLFYWTHPITKKNAFGGSLTRTSNNVDHHKIPSVISTGNDSAASGMATPIVLNMPSLTPNPECVRYSANVDYCGPSGNPQLSNLIPDMLLGPFRESCSRHDYCYYAGAETVIKEMERTYRMSMLSATDDQMQKFRVQMKDIKRECDNAFLKNLVFACFKQNALNDKCYKYSGLYYGAVAVFGANAFENAVKGGLTCPR